MKKSLIDAFMENRTADEMVIDILSRLPDEAYDELKYINAHTLENGADWATRQLQSVVRRYLSDDEVLMQLIDEDERECGNEQIR